MDDIIKVANLKILEALPNHADGEVAYCEEEQSYYVYQDGWRKVEATMDEEHGLQLNLYDLNKQVISQLKPFTDEQIDSLQTAISIWRSTNIGKYFLLYGKEISYFTLFERDDENTDEPFASVVIDCLKAFDCIKEYEVNENAVEIWVENKGEVTVLYLFNYDAGVVAYNG